MVRTIKIIKINEETIGNPVVAGNNTGTITKVTPRTTSQIANQEAEAKKILNSEAGPSASKVLNIINQVAGVVTKAGLLVSLTAVATPLGLNMAAIGQSTKTVVNVAQAILLWEGGDKLSGSLYLIKSIPGAGLFQKSGLINESTKWKLLGELLNNTKVKSLVSKLDFFSKLKNKKPIIANIISLSKVILSGDKNQIAQQLGTTVQAIDQQIMSQNPAAQSAQTQVAATQTASAVPAALQEHRKILKAKRTKKLSDLYE
jgi:hypothetical protein